MNIRKIEVGDLVSCARILELGYGRAPYNEIFLEGTALAYIEGKFKNCQEHSFVVVDENNIVTGFIFLNISSWSEGGQAILEEIVVNPESQGAGIGKQLIKHAHDYVQSLGVKSVMLWAKKDARLLDFYKHHGYSEADDFVVMFKNF